MDSSNPFALASLLGPKPQSDNQFGLKVPALKSKPKSPSGGTNSSDPASSESDSETTAANAAASSAANSDLALAPSPPGSPVDQAAMHGYIAASPQHALPNLAPIPFIAHALLGRTSGQAPIPWVAQHVLGLGPPGTGFGPPPGGVSATPPPGSVAPTPDGNALIPPGVDISQLPPVS